jgi:NAD(P)-dependent dehydrogenase (short-subunit alcohol dehydrogenase family)
MLMLAAVVTGATDGIGKEMAKEVTSVCILDAVFALAFVSQQLTTL